jgi:predicted DNA-binding transcriptional regulator YafY
LKQYNSRWFAFGLNSENQAPNWNLALDRIESISESSLGYKPTDIDWDSYFYDLVGVTRPEGVPLQEIVLTFSREVSPYVVTKPLHPSQKHKIEPNSLEVRITVIPNFELEKLILSFGEQVTVISPQAFKERITNRLKLANLLY